MDTPVDPCEAAFPSFLTVISLLFHPTIPNGIFKKRRFVFILLEASLQIKIAKRSFELIDHQQSNKNNYRRRIGDVSA